MTPAYQIIYSVHDAYRGLPAKLERITGKSDDWFRSHGYQPKNENPQANGNKSETDAYMTQCELYEAAEKGAGQMLADRVYSELCARFAGRYEMGSVDQAELECKVVDEVGDIIKWLARCDIPTATVSQLRNFEVQCAEAIEIISRALSDARAARILRNVNGRKERAA